MIETFDFITALSFHTDFVHFILPNTLKNDLTFIQQLV